MAGETPAGISMDPDGNLTVPGETLPEFTADKVGDSSSEQAPDTHSEESFMPRDQVASEHEKSYKSMQAAFTRKMQEYSDKLRGMDDLKKKADLFDAVAPVLQDPEFQQVVSAYKDGRRSFEAPSGVDDEPEIDPAVRAWLDKQLSARDEARRVETLQLQRSIELRDLAANHTDWRDQYPAIVAAVKANPSMSLENAYRLAKYSSLETTLTQSLRELEQLRQGKRKDLAVAPGTRVQAASPGTKPPETILEAAQRAIEKLNREGIQIE